MILQNIKWHTGTLHFLRVSQRTFIFQSRPELGYVKAVTRRGALISIVSLSSMEHLDLEIPYHAEWFIAQKEQKLTHLEIFGWFVKL